MQENKGPTNKTKLALEYKVSFPTMAKWLKKIGLERPSNGGFLYTPEELKTIREKLGHPDLDNN